MSILIHYDENNYLNDVAALQNIGLTHIQDVVNGYLALDIGKLFPSEFKRLFEAPEELIFDKITGGELAIQGIKVKKKEAMALLERPNGYDGLLQSINSVFGYLKEQRIKCFNTPVSLANLDKIFELNESLEVVVREDYKERMQAAYKKYATSDKAKAMYAFAKSILEKYDELQISQYYRSNGLSLGTVINEFITKETDQAPSIRINEIVKLN